MFKKRKRANGTSSKSIKEDAFFVNEEDHVGLSALDEDTKKPGKEIIEDEDEDPFKGETPDEKRLRLAKEYLEKITHASSVETDAAELDREIIAARLKQDVIEAKGKLQRRIASQLLDKTVEVESIRKAKGHQLSVTCVALSEDDAFAFSGSKDCSIIKWDIETGKKLAHFQGSRRRQKGLEGHIGQVLALSLSSDGRYLASGGYDKLVHIWDARTNKLIDSFKGHRDIITALSFRQGSNQLFSGSNDRTIKIWDVAEMNYVDTLYGHQSEITSLDSLRRERVISGSRDKTLRVWKVVEESQLVFKGHSGTIDCVSMINEEFSITGSEDGSIALWNQSKKKPVSVIKKAHTPSSTDEINWVSSVAALRNTDVVASGSCDGFIRLWKADTTATGNGALSPLMNIPMDGFVNGLAFANSRKFLFAGIGQEHRMGRWSSVKSAKNGIRIIPLPQIDDTK